MSVSHAGWLRATTREFQTFSPPHRYHMNVVQLWRRTNGQTCWYTTISWWWLSKGTKFKFTFVYRPAVNNCVLVRYKRKDWNVCMICIKTRKNTAGRSLVLERQLRPSAGCTGSLLDVSGHAHTCVPSGVGMQKWLQPPLFTEHAFFTPVKSKRWISSQTPVYYVHHRNEISDTLFERGNSIAIKRFASSLYTNSANQLSGSVLSFKVKVKVKA